RPGSPLWPCSHARMRCLTGAVAMPQEEPPYRAPRPLPPSVELPEPRSYRLKNRVLGPPLPTEQLAHERLGKPTALAVFASDNLSSVAYGTEEILAHLVPFVGLAAFTLVMPITVALLVVLGFLNLRGVKESWELFAAPTYFFIVTMILLLAVGIGRMLFGHLPVESLDRTGLVRIGHKGGGLLQGAALFVVLRAFASGGAAVTGVEAISNGVPAFRVPEWRNARTTLVIMGSTLGAMFFGLSLLVSKMHIAPYEKGTPTVISQIGKVVFGHGAGGQVLYYCLQAGTMLILVLAANTSFADFPRLASFHAGDNFMPRQLTKRGHRLVFSNGIIFLALAGIVLLIATDAKVDRLIPLYAIGVF